MISTMLLGFLFLQSVFSQTLDGLMPWLLIPSMTNRMRIIERNMMFEVLSFQKKDWQQVMAWSKYVHDKYSFPGVDCGINMLCNIHSMDRIFCFNLIFFKIECLDTHVFFITFKTCQQNILKFSVTLMKCENV